MKAPPDGPSVMAPEAAGGDHADGGFRFQGHLILARIPEWLAVDGFSQMIREALGDTEAKFFHPAIGETREFVEYKDHRLAPSEFWSEIDQFMKLDAGAPGAFRRFVLGCTSLSEQLSPLANALRRVRGTFPFYEGVKPIRDASYNDFIDTVTKLGKKVDVAGFMFDKVLLEDETPAAENMAHEVFRHALVSKFPAFTDRSVREINQIRTSLEQLVQSRKATPIYRKELEDIFWASAADRPSAVRLHTAHRGSSADPAPPGAIVVDWSAFSGEGGRTYPPPGEWNLVVVQQLKATRDWIIASGRPRRLVISGNRRLSAAVAIGSIFSAVHGFTLDLIHRGEVWSTAAHALSGTPDYVWDESFAATPAGEIAVAIGCIRDAAPGAEDFIRAAGLQVPLVRIFNGSPIVSAEQTNRAVMNAKTIISKALTGTGAKVIHLFLAGPSHLALTLGHRLNATARLRCYEWVGPTPGSYVPTCELAT